MKSIMETSLKRIVHLLLLAALSILTVNAKVISYPAPKGETFIFRLYGRSGWRFGTRLYGENTAS